MTQKKNNIMQYDYIDFNYNIVPTTYNVCYIVDNEILYEQHEIKT